MHAATITRHPARHSRPTRFTAQGVAAALPGDHTDPGIRGLQLRVGPRGPGGASSRTWLFRYKWRGATVRLKLGTFPTMPVHRARELALENRGLLEDGIDPRTARARRARGAKPIPGPEAAVAKHSVETLAADFMERFVRPHRKRPEYVQRILNVEVLPALKGRDVRTIQPVQVVELLDAIVDRGAPVMANRVAGVLGQLFKFAVHRRLIPASPVQLLFRPGGKERSRDRVLSDDELRVLLAKIEPVMQRAPHTAAAVRLMLLTACRRSELGLAKWEDVDLQAGLWRIPPENSKTGAECVTPLVAAAVDQFKALKRLAGGSRYVIPNEAGDAAADPRLLTRSLARHMAALKKLKVAKFSLHDCRRTVRTGLARLKIQPHIAERVLNHAQPGIVATYDVHAYVDEKRDALEAWAAHLQSLQA